MVKENKRDSFTSADALPVKLLQDIDVLKSIKEKKVIPPVHIQFIPTNKCNLKCPFCSCSNDDRNTEMSLDDAKKIIDIYKKAGTKAVTITGGGSPCLHPHINEIIKYFIENNIEVGMVDNGLKLKNVDSETLNKLTWCRISNADFRTFNDKYKSSFEEVIKSSPSVDWAFSHVVSENPNLEEIGRIINFANSNNFTHVRLVADLFQTENIDLSIVENYLKESKINDDNVIYQDRDLPERGGDCYIGYLKPLISADCKVYYCCGVQYSMSTPTKNLPDELCFGSVFDFDHSEVSAPKNGSICKKCYYSNYNSILKSICSENIEHSSFV